MSNTPKIAIGCVANVFVRQMLFMNAGDIEHGHTHPFDHLTLLANGSATVKVNGEETTYDAPHMIYIKAECEHEIVATKENTVLYCIHALRIGERVEDIIDPASVPKGISPINFADSVVCNPAR